MSLGPEASVLTALISSANSVYEAGLGAEPSVGAQEEKAPAHPSLSHCSQLSEMTFQGEGPSAMAPPAKPLLFPQLRLDLEQKSSEGALTAAFPAVSIQNRHTQVQLTPD